MNGATDKPGPLIEALQALPHWDAAVRVADDWMKAAGRQSIVDADMPRLLAADLLAELQHLERDHGTAAETLALIASGDERGPVILEGLLQLRSMAAVRARYEAARAEHLAVLGQGLSVPMAGEQPEIGGAAAGDGRHRLYAQWDAWTRSRRESTS